MSRIYWDSMLFIYFLEKHPEFGPRVLHIQRRIQERGDTLVTSIFTLGEVLTGVYNRGQAALAPQIERAIAGVAELVPFENRAAEAYAQIRATLRVRTADAIHLACAAEAQTDIFLTNDLNLVGKVVPGIQFIAGLQTDIL